MASNTPPSGQRWNVSFSNVQVPNKRSLPETGKQALSRTLLAEINQLINTQVFITGITPLSTPTAQMPLTLEIKIKRHEVHIRLPGANDWQCIYSKSGPATEIDGINKEILMKVRQICDFYLNQPAQPNPMPNSPSLIPLDDCDESLSSENNPPIFSRSDSVLSNLSLEGNVDLRNNPRERNIQQINIQQNQELKDKLSSLEQELKELKNKKNETLQVQLLQQQIILLAQILETLKNHPSHHSDDTLHKIGQEIALIHQKIDALLLNKNNQQPNAPEEIQKLQKELQDLQRLLAETQESAKLNSSAAQKQMDSLQAEYEQSLQKNQVQQKKLEQQINQLTEQLSQTQKEKQAFQRQLDDLNSQREIEEEGLKDILKSFVTQPQSLAEELDEEKNIIKSIQNKIETLQRELEDAQNKIEELDEQKQSEMLEKITAIESLENEKRNLHSQLKAAENKNAELSKMHLQFRHHISNLRKKIESLEAKMLKENQKEEISDSEISKLKEELNEAKKNLKNLKSEKSKLQEELNGIQNQIKNYQETIVFKEKKIEELNTKLSLKEKKLEELKNNVQLLLDEFETQKQKAERFENAHSQLQKTEEKELKERDEKIVSLESALECAQKQLKDMQKEFDLRKQRLEELEIAEEKKQEEIEQLKQKNAAFLERILDVAKEVDALKIILKEAKGIVEEEDDAAFLIRLRELVQREKEFLEMTQSKKSDLAELTNDQLSKLLKTDALIEFKFSSASHEAAFKFNLALLNGDISLRLEEKGLKVICKNPEISNEFGFGGNTSFVITPESKPLDPTKKTYYHKLNEIRAKIRKNEQMDPNAWKFYYDNIIGFCKSIQTQYKMQILEIENLKKAKVHLKNSPLLPNLDQQIQEKTKKLLRSILNEILTQKPYLATDLIFLQMLFENKNTNNNAGKIAEGLGKTLLEFFLKIKTN